jgi:DNA ligase-1
MLAQPVEAEAELFKLDPSAYAAEWKWDGIRVQAVRERASDGAFVARLYSRSGEDISAAFPDLLGRLDFDGAVDGELLVMREDGASSFSELQQRLNRKSPDARTRDAYPVGVRAYDLLADSGRDLRNLPFRDRRDRLEALLSEGRPGLDLSPIQPFESWSQLAALRSAPPEGEPRKAEGLMPSAGTLVQMETRSVPDRRGPDVRAARARQAV